MSNVIYPTGGQVDAVTCPEVNPGQWAKPMGGLTRSRLDAVLAAYAHYWAKHKVEKRDRTPGEPLSQQLSDGNRTATPWYVGA